jgi:hypothetical protein
MSGLLDILQGASNAAASNVSGPVDGLTWLLRKAGVRLREPVGGSEWMAKQGLTAQPQSQTMGLLGEALGMSAPIAAAAKAPQIARGLLKVGENAAVPRAMNPQKGAIVYHGSPHKFDAFDSSKIGTGEGAQAYGHGLYFAESDDVAKSYSGKLSSELAYNGKPMVRESARSSKDAAAWALYLADGDKATAKASGLASDAWIDKLDPGKLQPGGQLYKVDLPDEQIAKMLDWDKPLSQQTQAVRDALKNTRLGAAANKGFPSERGLRSVTMGEAYEELAGRSGSGLSSELRSAGIPGIRYLDGGSRGAGSGTSNYVVFPGEEGLLKILERK